MASLQVNLSTGEVGMAGGGGYFSSNVAVSGVQIADANGDLTNITANTIFASNLNVTGDFVTMNTITTISNPGTGPALTALTINQETSGDILQLQRSGAAKLTVLENGNLGIGTAAPQSTLHVSGSARVDGNALIGDSATADAHTVLGSASVTYSGTSTALTVNQQGAGKLFEVQDAGTARMTILDGGFVGIGTAAPQSALHVIGSASVSSNLVVSGNITATGLLTASNLRVLGDYVILDTISSNTEQMVITNDGTGPALKVTQTGANSIAEFYDDGNALAFKVANDGLIGIGTATPQAKLHVVGSVKATTSISSDTQFLGQAADTATTPSFSFAANPNTGIFQPTASNLAVTTGGVERMRVLANGNVGIGTTNPLNALHVQGTAQATTFSGSGSSLTTLNADNVSSGTLAVARGGTGVASYAVGDLIYASGTTGLSKLADVATGNSLISGGINVAPSWGKIGLTTHVSGTLGVANGGTGAATLTANKLLVGNGTTAVLQPTNLHWDNTNSRLGIGITSPLASMHVMSTSTTTGIIVQNADVNMVLGNVAGIVNGGSIQVRAGSVSSIGTTKYTLCLNPEGGNVGIGTTDVRATLHVNGTFYTPSMIIQSVIKQEFSVPAILNNNAANFDTGIFVTIIPKFATSKIVVELSTTMTYLGAGAMVLSLFRNGTEITTGTYKWCYYGTGQYFYGPTYNAYVDSPNTTSSITYRVYISSGNGYIVHQNSYWAIVANELAT